MKLRCRKVNSRKNSTSSASLHQLDWSNWWTDRSFGSHYLHVRHKDGETVHRVRCKHHVSPRLKMIDGELYWLFGEEAQ